MENFNFSINHFAISVVDMKKSIDFYGKFGFVLDREYHSEIVDIIMLKLGELSLELFYYPDHNPLPDTAKDLKTDLKIVGCKHFALGVDDIDKAKNFVLSNNLSKDEIEIVKGRLGKRYFYIKDPNGILIEIIEKEIKL